MRYYRHVNRDYLDWATVMGFIGKPEPIIFQLYCEPLQKFRLAARGHGEVLPPAGRTARASRPISIPLPFWYPPFEGDAVDETEFPMHAITQRPMAMYHSWGSQNAWLRQILGAQPALHEPRRAPPRSASPTTTGCGSRAASAASRRR